MAWIENNIGIVLQALLTIIGSSVAIWIAVFQQRAVSRREQQVVLYKTRSIAPMLMKELLELAIEISANSITLKHHEKILPGNSEEEVLKQTRIEIPKSMALDFSNAETFGPELTSRVAALQLYMTSYNTARTIARRIETIDEITPSMRALDKTLGSLVKN